MKKMTIAPPGNLREKVIAEPGIVQLLLNNAATIPDIVQESLNNYNIGMKNRPKAAKMLQVDLSIVLEALCDPTRRKILVRLENEDFCCSSFLDLGPKTRLAYHFARLEKAGLVRVTKEGTRRILSLNRTEAEAAFPGLLRSILASAKLEHVLR